MKALVTGANGFVGVHLMHHLAECGDEVVGIGPEIDVTEPEAVRHAITAAAPQAVYHLAALSHIGDSWDAPAQVFRVNAEGTLNVLRACTEAGAARVLVVGSADQYGIVSESDLPLHEDAPLRPATPYAASKVAAEYLALQAFLGDKLETIRVRAFNHTGPGQADRFVVPSLAKRIVEARRGGAPSLLLGALDPVRDFTDVRDVVRAYRLLIKRGAAGGVYNVCSGTGVTVAEIVERFMAVAGVDFGVEIDPNLVRPIEIPRLVGDNTRLREATGWETEIPLDQTLADVLEDLEARTA